MSICARCGAAFSCGAADRPATASAADASCWCMELPPLPTSAREQLPRTAMNRQPGCLCRNCLIAALQHSSSPGNPGR
ncbi:cysteine-rich CWC family protein [Paucimonas lemoignei]|uniref:cysteine-rich CWC family protein n=1 Tax=Paucimonas lemoignei TaxID=29443 RepID=UPI0010435475